MTSVLVAGAGPTGLTLACDLARRGVAVRIIDKLPEFPRGSRGKGLSQRTLEVLDDLCELLLEGSLCALGGLTPYPVLSAIQHFPEDFAKPAPPTPQLVQIQENQSWR